MLGSHLGCLFCYINSLIKRYQEKNGYNLRSINCRCITLNFVSINKTRQNVVLGNLPSNQLILLSEKIEKDWLNKKHFNASLLVDDDILFCFYFKRATSDNVHWYLDQLLYFYLIINEGKNCWFVENIYFDHS
jgi:hypothetical protein